MERASSSDATLLTFYGYTNSLSFRFLQSLHEDKHLFIRFGVYSYSVPFTVSQSVGRGEGALFWMGGAKWSRVRMGIGISLSPSL